MELHEKMELHDALCKMQRCKIPKLSDYSVLRKIETEEFFFSPPVKCLDKSENAKLILLSAPGAVGKTALSKYIAKAYGGLYWNVALKPLNGTSFAGEVAHAAGIGNGSLQDSFFNGLRSGKCLIIMDSFDEAELISGSDGVREFLREIGKIVRTSTAPTIILTARTGMARFIKDTCEEESIEIDHFYIDYFEEDSAQKFIEAYLEFQKISVTSNNRKIIEQYIDDIKQRIRPETDIRHFIGYAQVLEIISRQVETFISESKEHPPKEIPLDAKGNEHLIFDIIQNLIAREQNKLSVFKGSIRDKYIKLNKTEVVDNLYSREEQLVRLQYYSLANGAISLDDYSPCERLEPEDKKAYTDLLQEWLPQHVFLRKGKIMPVFSDYLLAESLLNPNLELFVNEYEGKTGKCIKLPTRVFMDCYLRLNDNCVNSEHIYFLDMAFTSQAMSGEQIYREISSDSDAPESNDTAEDLFLSFSDEKQILQTFKIIRAGEEPICLNRAENISVSVDGKVILTSKFLSNVTVRQASIECDDLEFDASEVVFETYANQENNIIIHHNVSRRQGGKIIVRGTKKLKVDFPASERQRLKGEFYELCPYEYTFNEDENGKAEDIEQFVYGLKKVLEQFRADRYPGDPAKYREKIDARCHNGVKLNVLNFLKAQKLIYEDGIMYKCSLQKMDELKISRVAYQQFYFDQLKYVYDLYIQWRNS